MTYIITTGSLYVLIGIKGDLVMLDAYTNAFASIAASDWLKKNCNMNSISSRDGVCAYK